MREVTYRYRDPLDVVWLDAAARIGLRIERSDDCYASTDGAGTLFIGSAAHLDADDCLSQMIFHELCHSLIEGPESFDRPDWDLDNESDRDLGREYACLRLQAALAATHGLRQVFAPTTDHRAFYDALPADPFSPRTDPSSVLALRGAARVGRPPWGPHLAHALVATQRIAEAVGTAAVSAPELLWSRFEAPIPPHPTGLEGAFADQGRCGDCAWQRLRGPGKAVPRCEQGAGVRVEVEWGGCARWEPEPSCLECGACCREAYGAVEVSARDPFVRLHPDLLTKRPRGYEIRREGERCAALEVQPPQEAKKAEEADKAGPSYMCVVYEDRPRTCRDFTRGSEHCLTARRRVGLSR